MKKTILSAASIIASFLALGQSLSKKYVAFVKQADSLYSIKDFKNSALRYTAAFKSNKWTGLLVDQYNAACSWALANEPDSAFFRLNSIAGILNFSDISHISNDPNLKTLYTDNRWKPLLEKIRLNKHNAESGLNKPLVTLLDSIYDQDQKYRLQIDSITKKNGWDSKELNEHWKIINQMDSINLIQVKSILDVNGWLGEDEIGSQGNSTLFLVIQHADQTTQEKYLPMMRTAVKNGKADANSLALLEDRVALRQGKRQIYGSQIGQDPNTKLYYVLPLEDPDNVDKRRFEVGLQPLLQYIAQWQIKWDVKKYKKDLPKFEKKLKP